jgi:hypothetical protein
LKATRWDLEVDPDGLLPESERYARADALRQAFYVRHGLLARRRHREARQASEVPGDVRDRDAADERHAREQERRLRGRLGGLTARARHDPRDATGKARVAQDLRFEARVDPDSSLPLEERRRRAEAARRAFYARLLLASIDARHRRAQRRGLVDTTKAERYKATRRQLVGRIGAYTRLASHDTSELTQRARLAWAVRLEGLVGDDVVDPHEREAKFEAAKSEFYRGLARRRRAGPHKD